MTETQSETSCRRKKGGLNQITNQNHKTDYKVDHTMVLLIGLKPDQCDTKEFMKLCDREIGVTQLVTIHYVDKLDMSDEHIQQYKDNGCDSCAVVLFRSYKKNQQNDNLQKDLLQNGLTHMTLDDEKYLVTHRRGCAW